MHGDPSANVRRQRRLASWNGVRRGDDLCHRSLSRLLRGLGRLRQQRGQRLRDEHERERGELRDLRDNVQRDQRHRDLHSRRLRNNLRGRLWELRQRPSQRLRGQPTDHAEPLRDVRDNVQRDQRDGDMQQRAVWDSVQRRVRELRRHR